MPEDLRQRTQRRAKTEGIAWAEFVRQSLVFRLGWLSALEAVRAGGDPDDLMNDAMVCELLALIAADPTLRSTHKGSTVARKQARREPL